MVYLPTFLRWIYPGAIWNIKSVSKEIYLTFDDGPTPGITEKVLELLQQYEAKATFFCIGQNIEKNPILFQLIKEKGHHVGSHTYSHLNGWKTSNDEYLADYQKGHLLSGSNLFRPPYGRLLLKSLQTIQKQDKVIMWDLLTEDYNQSLTPERILKKIKKHVHPGAIIVFHDSKKAEKNMISVLPELLEFLIQEGYIMKAIPYSV